MIYLNGYRLMWMLVMFDLPVGTKQQMREAGRFREFLLDEGFEKAQFSIYVRLCNSKERFGVYLHRIERHLPEGGDIQILGFTDKQYENIVRFSGRSKQRARKNPGQLALF